MTVATRYFLILCLVVTGAAPALALQEAPVFPRVEGVPVTVSLDFFDVSGLSQRRLDESIQMNGPIGFDAATISGFSAYWEYEANDQNCWLTVIEIPVEILIRYPRWIEQMRASRQMRDDWERRLAEVVPHENGHALIAFMTAVEIHNELALNGRAADCTVLEADINERLDTANRRLRERQREYDRITDHGTRQTDYDWAPIRALGGPQ